MTQLSPVLFWDVKNPDLAHDQTFIVERVMELGTLDDFRKVLSLYGREVVKHILLNSMRLSPRDVHFCGVIFEIDESLFACYTKKSLIQKPLRYWNP